MALTPTETQQLATLAQEVTRLTGTADDLLSLIRSASQGGAVDISTHNNSAAAHAGLFANYTYLTANKTYYLSATGNDANDGTSAAKPKGTWAGMHSLLASIDPRGYTVTVQVSGKFAGTCVFNLPQYSPDNLSIVGTNIANDGFEGSLQAHSGGFTPDKISVGQLTALSAGRVRAIGKTIRLTGLTAPTFGLGCASGGGSIILGTCTVEYSGAYNMLVAAYGIDIYLQQNSFVAIDNPTISLGVLSSVLGGRITSFSNTWTGDVTLTGSAVSIRMEVGGVVDINTSLADMPGGGTFYKASPGTANYSGVAGAYGAVFSSGLQGTRNFGVTSVTKTGTGVYEIETAVTDPYGIANTCGGTGYRAEVQRISQTSKNIIVRTFTSAGVATDAAFFFAAF